MGNITQELPTILGNFLSTHFLSFERPRIPENCRARANDSNKCRAFSGTVWNSRDIFNSREFPISISYGNCWCPSGWAPTWRLHTNLYKFGGKAALHISHKKNCCDLNLGENICIVIFLFSGSGLNLSNVFDIYFDLF